MSECGKLHEHVMLCGGSARKMGDLGRALGVQSRKGASSCAGVRSRDGIRGHLAHDDREIRVTMLAPEYSLVLDPSGALVTLLGLLEALQRAAAHAQRHVHVALYDSPGFPGYVFQDPPLCYAATPRRVTRQQQFTGLN